MRDKSKISFLKALKFSSFLLIVFLLFSGGIVLAKDINFGTAGDKILLNGNVGIGTTQVANKLNITGGVDLGIIDSSNLFRINYDATNGGTIQSFIAGAYAKMSLNPGGGNVGIGATNPAVKLDVSGNVLVRGSGTMIANAGAGELQLGYAFGVGGTVGSVTRLAIQPYGHTGGPWKIISRDVATTAYLDTDYGATHGTTLDSSGDFGIGTTNPAYKLDVNGYGNFNSNAIHNVGTPSVDSDVATQGYVKSSVSGANFWSGTLNGNIWNGAAGAGNVGIGGTAPAVRLDVQGGTNSYGTNIYGMWTPDGNSLIRNWALNDGANNYTGTYTSVTDAPLGSKTMRYSSNTYFRNAQWIPVDTTRTYKVSVWGRTISGTPNNYLSLTQAGSDLSQPSNGGWGNPYWGVVNQPFPAAWTYYTMTIGPSGSGANYAWSAGTKYVQLGALMIYTGSGVCEISGYKIEEVENTIAYNASALGSLAAAGNVTAERFKGNNSLALSTYTTINPASNVFLYSQPNDRDSWLYLDSADTGSNWGIYHRQIDSAVSSLSANSIGFVGGGASTLQASISLANGNAYFAGSVGIGNTAPGYKLDVIGNGAFRSGDSSYLYFGPNASWGGSLYIGATTNKLASRTGQVIVSDGNLHIDSGSYAGNDIYLNYYNSGHGIRIFGPTNMNGNQINSLGTPTSASDAATKGYVDSASVGNASTVAGLAVHAGRNNEANKIVRTDGSGYLQTGYINSSSGDESNNSNPTKVWGTNGSDSYLRTYYTSALSVNYAASAGNANTVDGQNFVWSNQNNNPTYLWAADSNGNGYLAWRAGMSVSHADSAASASNASTADKVNGYGSSPDNSHPGTGLRPFYSWNIGQAGNATAGYSNGISVGSNPGDQAYGFQIVQNMWDDRLYFRRYNGGWQGWLTVIDSATIGSQSVNYAASAGSTGVLTGSAHVNGSDGWFRSNGQAGWYSESYGVGVYATQAGRVDLYNGASLYVPGSVTASSYVYSSDRNLKKNIATIQNPLEKILQLRGVTFDWKKDNKPSVGLIAQEVEKVFPELVSSDGTNKGVQYGNLVAPLIEAVKAQQKQIEDSKNQQIEADKVQQKEIDLLKAKIKTLETKNKK